MILRPDENFNVEQFLKMHHFHIFTDGSVHAKSKVGYGAYLVVSDFDAPVDSYIDRVKVKRFEQTSSTKLELQTLLWALDETIAFAMGGEVKFTVYTDCQNIIGLPSRRDRLEQRDYYSSKNKRLNNYLLYQAFYELTAKIECALIKVIGHQTASKKDKIDRLFSLVDRASRRALREDT